MKPITMIMTLAAGIASFGLAASAENNTKQPNFSTYSAQPATMAGASAFLPSPTMKKPAWVTYGSIRK